MQSKMSNEESFDKIFSEITSPENLGVMSEAAKAISLSSARDYSLFMAELITAVQEINLIIINLIDPSDEPFSIPEEIILMLESIYSKAKEFNNYMINLDEDDLGYFFIIDEDEGDEDEDNGD